jgi:hypothetical protein
MTRRPRPFKIERRPIPPHPAIAPKAAHAADVADVAVALGPIAREVASALRGGPIRFPKDWVASA